MIISNDQYLGTRVKVQEKKVREVGVGGGQHTVVSFLVERMMEFVAFIVWIMAVVTFIMLIMAVVIFTMQIMSVVPFLRG